MEHYADARTVTDIDTVWCLGRYERNDEK